MPLVLLGLTLGGGASVTAASLISNFFDRGSQHRGKASPHVKTKASSHVKDSPAEDKGVTIEGQSNKQSRDEENALCLAEEPDFELWVETDLEAAWCLEASLETETAWRESCSTAKLRRRWDDFETLTQRQVSGSSRGHVSKARGLAEPRSLGQTVTEKKSLRLLSLKEGCTEAEVRARFRQLCLTCHPDKGGTSGRFEAILEAYRCLTTEA